MKKILSLCFFTALALMPGRVKRFIYNRFLGAEIHPTARIGFSCISVRKIRMGAYAEIGHLNVITGLELLELQEKAVMLGRNRITALPLNSGKHFHHNQNRFPALVMEPHASITGKHYFDCNDTIRIGAYATIAGLGSAFFTHGIDLANNRQETAPVIIGKYTMTGACCVMVKGSALPDYSVLAANSTLHKVHDAPYTLYSGVPAVPVKKLDVGLAYFHRKEGFVD